MPLRPMRLRPMRLRALGAVLLVTLVGCGGGATRSVSTQQAAPAGSAVDPGAIATRWRVLKTAPGEARLRTGDLVEFRAGGAVASGPDLTPSTATWAVDGTRFELRDQGTAVAYTASLVGDVLELVDGSGQSDVLRRFLGQPTGTVPAGVAMQEADFFSLLGRGRVETATLTQSGTVITVTGTYYGDSSAQRYAVTLLDCNEVRTLDALFRAEGVLADGLPASEVQC